MNPFRNFFLYLSEKRNFERFISKFPPTKALVDRFVAGYTLEDALKVMKKLNGEGIRVTIDMLGESILDRTKVNETLNEYMKIVENIKGTENSIAVKLTSLGLDISKDTAYQNVRKLVELSDFLEIDMESSKYTSDTIDIYISLKREFPQKKIALAIQSYLKRSMNDVINLVNLKPIIRVVKGAYKEPESIAYKSKRIVNEKYREIARFLLENTSYTLIATHDESIISYVKSLNFPKDKFEFQFLYGVKNNLLRKLKDEGYRTAIYLPYGTQWYPYFMRRLAERPANVWFVFSNLFRG